VYLIQDKNGVSRKTRTGAQSERRVWKCRGQGCGKQFSVLTGTIVHGTKIPVRTWVLVFLDFMADKNGMSPREVERKYGMCPRSAWHMLHRIRKAMAAGDAGLWENTTVIADEAYIGGDPKNRHADKRRTAKTGRGTDEDPVVSILDNVTGEVRSRVVASPGGRLAAFSWGMPNRRDRP
jgi:ISXO2-like transposase domain